MQRYYFLALFSLCKFCRHKYFLYSPFSIFDFGFVMKESFSDRSNYVQHFDSLSVTELSSFNENASPMILEFYSAYNCGLNSKQDDK